MDITQEINLKAEDLKNTYFALRHGESIPNVKGILLSDPISGLLNQNGLTENGIGQAKKAASNYFDNFIKPNSSPYVVICSSNFSRAVQTSLEFKQELGIILSQNQNTTEVLLEEVTSDLRERYFGEFEATSGVNNEKVWKEDELCGSHHRKYNAESLHEVLHRTLKTIQRMETKYTGQTIIIVSHGDVLQILQTWFVGQEPRNHRKMPHLHNAELRKFN